MELILLDTLVMIHQKLYPDDCSLMFEANVMNFVQAIAEKDDIKPKKFNYD